MFDKLAEELKEARLKNNLTLSQLASRTRIDLKFLEAMEEGNFSFLPDLYVKAFVKEYANVVGLDQEKMLKKYEAAKEGLPYEEPSGEQAPTEPEPGDDSNKPEDNADQNPPEKQADGKKEQEEKFREVKYSAHQSNAVYSKPPPTFDSTKPKRSELVQDKNAIMIGASIGGAIILIGLIYLLFFNQSSEIVVPEKPYDEVVTESRQRYEETPVQPTDSLSNNSVSGDSLNLLIQASDTSWIKIILDNTKEEEFILFPNSQKSIRAAKDFKITFGRSSAIKLQLNNKPLEFNPSSKSVSHVKINSGGLKFLHSPPLAGQEQ